MRRRNAVASRTDGADDGCLAVAARRRRRSAALMIVRQRTLRACACAGGRWPHSNMTPSGTARDICCRCSHDRGMGALHALTAASRGRRCSACAHACGDGAYARTGNRTAMRRGPHKRTSAGDDASSSCPASSMRGVRGIDSCAPDGRRHGGDTGPGPRGHCASRDPIRPLPCPIRIHACATTPSYAPYR